MGADLKRINKKRLSVCEAEESLDACMREEFPEGSRVRWEHCGHMQIGTVLYASRHGVGALNARTGKKVRVSLYSILLAADFTMGELHP